MSKNEQLLLADNRTILLHIDAMTCGHFKGAKPIKYKELPSYINNKEESPERELTPEERIKILRSGGSVNYS